MNTIAKNVNLHPVRITLTMTSTTISQLAHKLFYDRDTGDEVDIPPHCGITQECQINGP